MEERKGSEVSVRSHKVGGGGLGVRGNGRR